MNQPRAPRSPSTGSLPAAHSKGSVKQENHLSTILRCHVTTLHCERKRYSCIKLWLCTSNASLCTAANETGAKLPCTTLTSWAHTVSCTYGSCWLLAAPSGAAR